MRENTLPLNSFQLLYYHRVNWFVRFVELANTCESNYWVLAGFVEQRAIVA